MRIFHRQLCSVQDWYNCILFRTVQFSYRSFTNVLNKCLLSKPTKIACICSRLITQKCLPPRVLLDKCVFAKDIYSPCIIKGYILEIYTVQDLFYDIIYNYIIILLIFHSEGCTTFRTMDIMKKTCVCDDGLKL